MLHDILEDNHIQWHPPWMRRYTNFWPFTDLDLITEFDLIVWGFNRTFATGAACQLRTLTPPDTCSCPTLGLACVLMSKPISPELVLFPDFWVSNTPRYFCFAFKLQRRLWALYIIWVISISNGISTWSIRYTEANIGWLVVLRILRRFSGISATSRLGSRRWPIYEIQRARPGIELRTPCSASQELNHSTTAAQCFNTLSYFMKTL